MPNIQGPPDFTSHPSGYDAEYNLSLTSSGSETATYRVSPTNELVSIPYIAPHQIDVTSRHYNSAGVNASNGVSYSAPTQCTDPSIYALAGVTNFNGLGTGSIRHPDLNLEATPKIPTTIHRQPAENIYSYYTSSSDAHQLQVSSRHQRVDAPDQRLYTREAFAAEPPILSARKRGSSDGPEFRMPVHTFSRLKLEDAQGGPHHLSCIDVESQSLFNTTTAVVSSVSSIPMSNQVWSRAFSSSAFDQESAYLSSKSQPTVAEPSSTTLSAEPLTTKKKKKSKMHKCEVCGKWFPRPSGLKTHMNAHNNLKPFSCGYPGCSRTFTVRSNAKRHFRTHGGGTAASKSSPMPSSYIVGFNPPTIAPPSLFARKIPVKLRWMPPSLTTRTNAEMLTTVSDDDSDSDDESEAGRVDWDLALSIPLHPVIPSSFTDNTYGQIEERNSYLDAPLYPYHPSQFRALPGPAIIPPMMSH